MNEKLQVALSELLSKSVGAFETGTTFLSGQLPDVIKQLLIWKAIESAIVFSLGLILLGITIYGNYRQYLWIKSWYSKVTERAYDGDTEGIEDHPELVFNLFQIFSLLLILIFLSHIDWLKIWLAPKVYLIEYAAQLVKGAG